MESDSTERRSRERAFRNAWLLDAAEAVFLERGFAGASMQDIARRSEVALATLYKAFSGKDELFVLVMERRMSRFLETLRRATSERKPLARIEQHIRATVEYFAAEAEVFRLYLAATQGFPWRIRSRLGKAAAARYQELIGEVETMCRTALPPARRRSARTVALLLVGGLNAAMAEWLEGAVARPPAAVATEVWSQLRRLFAPS
jgi:AcrR family transcriptional regulator